MRRYVVWGGLVLLTPLLAGAFSPTGIDQDGAVAAGRIVYLSKCASCHGEAATGHGPASRTLRRQPTDLTTWSSRTRPFNRESLRLGITGAMRLQSPDGADEMPHWRGSLDAPVPVAGSTATELDALLAFLETIQREPFGADPTVTVEARARAGAPLFAMYCAGCHGRDGRGWPSPGVAPPNPVPDLTAIAERNGGTVDIRNLHEWIAHGDHERGGMPAWDKALRTAGWPAVLTAEHIEAIARYVESIQRR